MERDATRVLNGVNVWGYPTGCSELWEPCSDGTYRVKDDESEQLDTEVRLVRGLQARSRARRSGCRDAGRGAERPDQRACWTPPCRPASRRHWRQGCPGRPTRSSGTPTSTTSPDTGHGGVAGCGSVDPGGRDRRHVPAGMIGATPATHRRSAGVPDRRHRWTDGCMTANGTPVYSADGLIGPRQPTTSPHPTSTEDWMFAHGPVTGVHGADRDDRRTRVPRPFRQHPGVPRRTVRAVCLGHRPPGSSPCGLGNVLEGG